MQNLSIHIKWAKIHRKHNINKGGICEMLLTKKKQSGFTIVELLIVIVIIGILAALVLNTFTGAQQKARDAKRDTDTKAIATQLEACFNEDTSVTSNSCSATAMGQYPLLLSTSSTGNLKSLDPKATTDPKGNVYVVPTAISLIAPATCTTASASTAFTNVTETASVRTFGAPSKLYKYIYVPLTQGGGPCVNSTPAQSLCTTNPCGSWVLLWEKENGGWQMKVGLN